MQPLAKLYDSLDADQRFRLFMAAMARDDLAEADKIDAGCPRKTYVMEDMEYLRRKQKAFILCLHHIANVWIFRSVELLSLVSMLVSDEAEGKKAMYEQAANNLEKLISVRLAKLQAWEQFADEAGIPPELAEKAVGLPVEAAEANAFFDNIFADVLGSDAVPCPEQVQKHRALLMEMWDVGGRI